MGGIVFLCRANKVVPVSPAGCGFGLGLCYVPFADYEGDVGEVAADGLDVCFQRRLVGVGAPDRLAPGLEDEVVWRGQWDVDTMRTLKDLHGE